MSDVFRRQSEDPFERDDEPRVPGEDELRVAHDDPAEHGGVPDETAVEDVRAQLLEPSEVDAGEPEPAGPAGSPAEAPAPAAEAVAPEPAVPAAPAVPASPDGPVPQHAPGTVEIPEGVGAFVGTPDGRRRNVAIAVARFNGDITTRLLDGALARLEEAGVTRDRVDVLQVPGSFELPLAAMALAKSRRYACVLALGCVVRGDTPHFEYVAAEAASGVQLAGLETGIPVAFGVLTCDDRAQAEARAGGEHGNKGVDAAETALEMADVLARLRAEGAVAAPAGSAARAR